MPPFKSSHFAVMIDVAGCPNRCRHCWLGNPANGRVTKETVHWIVQQFRQWVYPGEKTTFVKPLTVMSWYREPDFAKNYRELWQLEKDLSDDAAAVRFELLSVWRLAHDESYARWARDIGTDACQITLFGLEETTDYFARRRGYFKDCMIATNRLLDAGIKPRWQLFLTSRGLQELSDFVSLIKEMDLDRRVRQLGQEFHIFARTPAPDGEAYQIENLRPTVDALSEIPRYLIEKTMQYFDAATLEECFGMAEADWMPQLLEQSEPLGAYPETLAFMITPALDVFSNIGEPMPWWKIGNLREDNINLIMQRFENDEILGLKGNFQVPVSSLAQLYGRNNSNLLYSRDDLVLRWVREWCEGNWQ